MAAVEEITTFNPVNTTIRDENVSCVAASFDYDNAYYKALERGILALEFYFVPFIICVGLVGNTVSFVVFVRSRLRTHSSSIYLAALAVTDNGVLLCILAVWSTRLHIQVMHRNVWCQAFVYCTYVTSFLSVWYIVSFTVERYIAICLPFQRQAMCTVRKSRRVVVALAVLAAIGYSFLPWTSAPQEGFGGIWFCHTLPRYMRLVATVSSVDTALTLVLPFFVIAVLNARIIYAVMGLGDRRHGSSPATDKVYLSTQISSNSASSATLTNSSNNSQIRVTKMLVVVSSVFLLLNFPSHAVRFYVLIRSMSANNPCHVEPPYTSQFRRLFEVLYYVNFSVNFFLYSACGKNFRAALRSMCVHVDFMSPLRHCAGSCLPNRFYRARTASQTRSVLSRSNSSDKAQELQVLTSLGKCDKPVESTLVPLTKEH